MKSIVNVCNEISTEGIFNSEEIKNLFKVLSESLYDANTPLRKYVDFIHLDQNTLDSSSHLVFLKKGKFIRAALTKTDFSINFTGSLEKYVSGQIFTEYVKDVVYGYMLNEERIINNFEYKYTCLVDMFKEAGYGIDTSKPSTTDKLYFPIKLQGLYFDHNFNITPTYSGNQLTCTSKIAFFL